MVFRRADLMFRSVQKISREPVPSGEFVTHCLVVTTSTPPSFAATAPDGTRIVVHPHASTDSVEELARALDLPAPTALAIDGIAVERHQRLADTDVRVGSAITVRANDGRSEEQVTGSPSVPSSEAGTVGAGTVGVGTVEVAIVSGPACASWRRLVVGRHTVGRAPFADVCIDDPAVELHHGMLDVGAGGEVGFTELTGRVPITVGGVPCSGSHPVRPDEVIRCGASELLVRVVSDDTTDGLPDGSASVGSVVVSDVDPWRRVVRRAPPVAASGPVQPIEVPEPPGEHRAPPLTSLVGAGVAVARGRAAGGGARPGDVCHVCGDRRPRIVRDVGSGRDRGSTQAAQCPAVRTSAPSKHFRATLRSSRPRCCSPSPHDASRCGRRARHRKRRRRRSAVVEASRCRVPAARHRRSRHLPLESADRRGTPAGARPRPARDARRLRASGRCARPGGVPRAVGARHPWANSGGRGAVPVDRRPVGGHLWPLRLADPRGGESSRAVAVGRMATAGGRRCCSGGRCGRCRRTGGGAGSIDRAR